MPNVDYRCSICNAMFEISKSVDEESPAPICCGMSMNRIWTAVPIKFNGGGFYSTGG